MIVDVKSFIGATTFAILSGKILCFIAKTIPHHNRVSLKQVVVSTPSPVFLTVSSDRREIDADELSL
jgi:hypothetical protein